MAAADPLMSQIEGAAGGSAAERIRNELRYALSLDGVNQRKHGDLIRRAAERLCARINADGCITNDAARECEETLLPMQEDAKALTVHFTGHAHIDMN